MAREAWFYEEMECLQGVAIARCYGFFQTELSDSVHIGLWDNDEGDEDNEGVTEAAKVGADNPRVLSILLLERLGDRMPFGEPTPAGAREDMTDIYSDMSELGIYHSDIRWQNYLHAPASPPGLPGLPSPYKHRTYAWRVIDFDNSEKNNFQPLQNNLDYSCFIRRVFDNIPIGHIVDPWDL
ncbi:hypothetical protein PLICRDRAFT_179195 [Plicaturopsis crispa FD-325 SS-3]|uniref:Protein kinase domain-containing protein n=1 Tax=Plicaturopsis crispa FD-325 SS-3 TaxID=944288 RepID=A0A0C9SY82_PLICR|nr:hypothetical protein PLICRDRAFT_179195 [Plicaturopsis crispa FD-325 SS-3]